MATDPAPSKLRVPIDWQLPKTVTRRLGDTAGRQRAMSAEGHLLLILHEPPTPGVSQRSGRLFWRDPKGNWMSTSRGVGVRALTAHLQEFAERAEGLERDLERAETAEDYYALLRTVAPLHRAARNLHATLQQAREAISEDTDLINARDQSGEIERTLELLHNDAGHGLDFTVARQAEQQAEAAHRMSVAGYRLNLLAAAFFPIATIGAIFGMNLKHGLEGEASAGLFWVLLVMGLVSGLVLTVFIMRKPARPKARTDAGNQRQQSSKRTATPVTNRPEKNAHAPQAKST